MGNIVPKPLFDTLSRLTEQVSLENLPSPSGDYGYALHFLINYRGNAATYNAYRKEIERLLQWCKHIKKQSLCALSPLDIEAFFGFCQNPPAHWIGTKNVARFTTSAEGRRLPHPEWRPFASVLSKRKPSLAFNLSEKSLRMIASILSSFFNYLVEKGYTGTNPVKQIRQKSKFFQTTQQNLVIRRLSETQWFYIIDITEKKATAQPQYERSLFILKALYSMYLRISELATSERWLPKMSDFFRDTDNHWWFHTVGKGNKKRQIAVSDAMLHALMRYRNHLGLSPLPAPGETLPLVSLRKNLYKPLQSTRQIRNIVQECFDWAIQALIDHGLQEESDQLQSATVHWLRHTGISEDVKHRPREHVRDDAGHSSSKITDQYIDVELRERHASNKKKSLKPFSFQDDPVSSMHAIITQDTGDE